MSSPLPCELRTARENAIAHGTRRTSTGESIRTLGEGESFGERALIYDEARSPQPADSAPGRWEI